MRHHPDRVHQRSTDAALIYVSVQMLLGLLMIAGVGHLLTYSAETGLWAGTTELLGAILTPHPRLANPAAPRFGVQLPSE